MTAPTLSVCLVTYNHAPFVEAAIRSVLSQNLDFPWEFIVADDCSTDGTQDIVRKYAKLHPERIRPIIQETNLGAWKHTLETLRAARGEFIGYLEGDDRYTDDAKLRTQVTYLRDHPSCVGCFHDLTVVDEHDSIVSESFLASSGSAFKAVIEQEDLFSPGAMGQTNSWVYRRRYIDELPRWFVEFPLDKSLAFYLANFGSWGYIDRRMSVYRLHGGGIYSPLPKHRQNEMLLKHTMMLHSVPEYRDRYGATIRSKICHYDREIARAYKGTNLAEYLKHLGAYVRYHPNRITALKVLLAEEIFAKGRSG